MIRTLRLLALLLCLLAASGCLFSDDEDNDSPTGPEEPVLPESAVSLMNSFRYTYQEGDLDLYGFLLHEQFEFVLKGDDGVLTRDEELAVFEAMSSGQQGQHGIAIEDVVVNSLTALDQWEPVPAEDPDFGNFAGTAYFQPYEVSIDFNIAGQLLTYQVRGLVVFYAAEVDGGFQLLGMADNTAGEKATESHSWSSIRLLFH